MRRLSRSTTIPDSGSKPTSVTFTSIFRMAADSLPVLLTTWAYSNCPFAIALPTERTEAIRLYAGTLRQCDPMVQ